MTKDKIIKNTFALFAGNATVNLLSFFLMVVIARCLGNVVIATRHNYLPEIVSEENGCLVDVKSPRMIEDAVARFVEDKERMEQVQKYNINYAKKSILRSST